MLVIMEQNNQLPGLVVARAIVEDRNEHDDYAAPLTRSRMHRSLYLLNNLYAYANGEPLCWNPVYASMDYVPNPNSYRLVYTREVEAPIIDTILRHRPSDDRTYRSIMDTELMMDEYSSARFIREDGMITPTMRQLIRIISGIPDNLLNRNTGHGPIQATLERITRDNTGNPLDERTIIRNNEYMPYTVRIPRTMLTTRIESTMEPFIGMVKQ